MSEPRVHIFIRKKPEIPQRPSRGMALGLWLIAFAAMLVVSAASWLLKSASASADVFVSLAFYLLGMAVPIALLLLRKKSLFPAFRPNPIGLMDVLSITLLALLGVSLVNNIAALWSILLEEIGYPLSLSPIEVASTPAGLCADVLLIAALPAICEEFLFRGAIFSAFEPCGTRRAALASALLFALMHASVEGLPLQLLLGLLLALLVFYTNSIYAGLVYHTVHNAACVVLQFLQNRMAEEEVVGSLLEAIGGGRGLLMLLVETVLLALLMSLPLRILRMRAKLCGVEPAPRKRLPYRRGEILLLCLVALAVLILYGATIYGAYAQ